MGLLTSAGLYASVIPLCHHCFLIKIKVIGPTHKVKRMIFFALSGMSIVRLEWTKEGFTLPLYLPILYEDSNFQ